jgi:diadenosine tetraphosphate (Ap4A) HIT family hydrolase
MLSCNLCRELEYKSTMPTDVDYTSLVESGASRIVETENFVVLPSVGPIDAFHVMAVPRVHVNSFAALPSSARKEARELLLRLRTFVEQAHARTLIFFESGAGTRSDHSGGCIVHAHIHAVSACPSFSHRLQREVALERQVVSDPFEHADTKFGYVWFMDESESEYVCNRPLLPSQFLRYLYSQSCGVESMWNWRRHPNTGVITEILRNYRGLV